MFCAKCGCEMKEGTFFCPECGQKTGESVQGSKPQAENTGNAAEEPAAEKAPVSGAMRFQGVGIRFVALIVDAILLFIPFYLIGNAMAKSAGEVTSGGWSLSRGPAFLFFLIMLVIAMGYYTLFEGGMGATPGKFICGVRVLDESGAKCGYRQAFIRNILRVIDGLFFYLVGAILVWKSPKSQRLGDRAAETVVVKK